jgi:hypothetical protein
VTRFAAIKEVMMVHWRLALSALCLAPLTACGDGGAPANQQSPIKVRGPDQDRLHQLDAFNLAIALKHAIYDAGFTCRRVTGGGFVAQYENLDMWTASCDDGRQWAIFAGPDGSAQVRDCKDVAESGLPACNVSRQPKGSFTDPA